MPNKAVCVGNLKINVRFYDGLALSLGHYRVNLTDHNVNSQLCDTDLQPAIYIYIYTYISIYTEKCKYVYIYIYIYIYVYIYICTYIYVYICRLCIDPS
jgi:hypothetical protein